MLKSKSMQFQRVVHVPSWGIESSLAKRSFIFKKKINIYILFNHNSSSCAVTRQGGITSSHWKHHASRHLSYFSVYSGSKMQGRVKNSILFSPPTSKYSSAGDVQSRLKHFIAIWNCIDLDFNMLVALEVHCVEKNPDKFSSKKINFFSTEERKTWTSWMTLGWVNYQDIFILSLGFFYIVMETRF